MPSSDQMFGSSSKAQEPQGQPAFPPSMFKNLRGGMLSDEPDPEEMARQFDAALHDKHVNLKEVHVEVFNMMIKTEREAYCKLYRELYAKVQSKQALVRTVERRFVAKSSDPVATGPTWLVYLEWWDYALEVDGKEVTPEELDQIKRNDSAAGNMEETDPPVSSQLTARQAAEGDTNAESGQD